MERHFHQELNLLRQRLIEMSFRVEEALVDACDALFERDESLAQKVIEGDKDINAYEIEIDDKGHSLFALGQPMAVDLRRMMMILKINTDLERVGDHAVNIAEKARFISNERPLDMDLHMERMANTVQKMFRDALNAFLKEDVQLAQGVLEADDEVDEDNSKLYYEVGALMEKDSRNVSSGMNWMMVGHNLERIGDLASNISEDVIYLKKGMEVRHHRLDSSPSN